MLSRVYLDLHTIEGGYNKWSLAFFLRISAIAKQQQT